MAVGTCFRPKEKQLYMLEFLVDHLNLTPEKVQEIGIAPLCIRLNFIDFPVFEITQEEFISSENEREEKFVSSSQCMIKDGCIDFNTGKSCLFSKQPRDFVQAIQLQPLKIGVYKLFKKSICSSENEDFPICGTQVPLSGCLCDHVAMAMNDIYHLPKPYTLKNTYNLIDSQSRPSGTIAIFIRLSCFGKSIVTYFAFQDKSFLFKNAHSSNEFQCIKISSNEKKLVKTAEEIEDRIYNSEEHNEAELNSPKLQAIVGLAPICQELVKRDGGPPEITPSLLPRSQIKDNLSNKKIDFTKSLGNLNNKYSMNQQYPSDPTCVCSSNGTYLKLLTGKFPCTGASCMGGLCIGTKLLDPPPRDYHGGTKIMPCYTGSCCTGHLQSDAVHDLSCCGKYRMRGGGGCCEHDGEKTGYINYTGGNHMLQMGNSSKFESYRSKSINLAARSNNAIVSNAWESPLESKSANAKSAECCCLGKTGVGRMNTEPAVGMKGNTICSKKPCLGIDCLIRTFKETQDFVDSIGKVPGLAGLGLMDPSESPYFGRNKNYTETTYPVKNSVGPSQHVPPPNTSNPQCFSLCSTQISTKPAITKTNSLTTTAGRFVAMRDTLGNAISAVPNKQKKKDEKVERSKEPEVYSTPPLEIETNQGRVSKSKSKRRKVQDELNSVQQGIKLPVGKKTPLLSKPEVNSDGGGGGGGSLRLSSTKTEEKIKQQTKNKLYMPGPAGDRNVFTNSHIKVSKRIMKSIYSMGTKYNPGINYGHKNCLDFRTRVPANMGWLWNTNMIPGKIKPRLGWKPGAISKYLYNLLEEAKTSADSAPESRPATPTKGKKGKVTRIKSVQSLGRNQRTKNKKREDEHIELPPTLHIHRKQGTYYVTMYPVKQDNMEQEQLEKPLKPIQFKITKNKDDDSVCSSSTASDMELEFSPPAAITRYRKRPSVIHIDTQVKQQDILDAFKLSGTKEGKNKKGKKNKGKK